MTTSFWRNAANHTIKYLLIILVSAGAVGLMLSLHTSLLIAGLLYHIERYMLWVAEVSGMILLGAGLLFSIAAIDSYIQNGMKNHQIWPRALRVVEIEAVVAIFVVGLELVLRFLLAKAG
jgi:hypothetical protein